MARKKQSAPRSLTSVKNRKSEHQDRSTLVGQLRREENQFNPFNNFANSIRRKRYGAAKLKDIAQTILFDRAIERISNGVAGLPWVIHPPKTEEGEKVAKKVARISKALKRPNLDVHNTYRKFIKAIVRDMLIFGTAIIERQESLGGKDSEDHKPFFLWTTNVENIRIDEEWQAADGDTIPRFWYATKGVSVKNWQPIYNSNMFLVQTRASSYEVNPPSPIQLAYDDMQCWLNLHEFQKGTVSNAVRDYMLSLVDASSDELDGFRDYWNHNVVGLGEIPIWSGKVEVVKFGARNDAELFPQYTEYLTGLIALEFGLNRRDFDFTGSQNYATANIASDMSFQESILPIAQCVIEHLSWEVIDYYFEEFTLELADTEPRKEIEEAQRADTLYKGNLATRNEARAWVGLESLPQGGDKFADGSGADGSQPEPPPGQMPPGADPNNPNTPVPPNGSQHSNNPKEVPTDSKQSQPGNQKGESTNNNNKDKNDNLLGRTKIGKKSLKSK